uniref:NAD(P)-dependent alcohol dehydrogenase n=1 Tax=Streptomyces sp. NBC_00148 TaxID=2903626 RepID=A0AAU1M2T8_9ACTN
MNITAALSRGPKTPFALETVTMAPLQNDEVRVRLVAAGMCHTDLVTKAGLPAEPAAVFGHEGAGIVEAVGTGISGVDVGDKVLLTFRSCGKCHACAQGKPGYCDSFVALNSSGRRADGSVTLTQDGEPLRGSYFGQSSFATHAIASQDNVVVVDPDTDLAAVAPFACGFMTGAGAVVNVLAPDPDARVIVYGAGGVGMAAVMAAAALGVRTIVAVDLSEERREAALAVGATAVVDGRSDDLVKLLVEATGGGATHAVDSTAVPSVISSAVAALAPQGTLVLLGLGAPEVTFNVMDLITSGKTVRGCIEGDSDPRVLIPQLVRWHAEGKFPLEKVIRHYAFADINTAMADSVSGSAIKPILVFDEPSAR